MNVEVGDRARIDLVDDEDEDCSEFHGQHGTIRAITDDEVEIALDAGGGTVVSPSQLRPTVQLRAELVDREHETVRNIWAGAPADLRQVDTEQLWAMHERVSQAIARSLQDDDMEAMGVLVPIGVKVSWVLAERSRQ